VYRVINNITDNNLDTKIEDGITFLLIGENWNLANKPKKGDFLKKKKMIRYKSLDMY